MRIGELAQETGKSVAALRYYEQIGLLPAPQRTETGYRDYAPELVERVRFILHAQERGFSLKEIAAVLGLQDRGQAPCQSAARITRRKVERLDKKIAQLQTRRAMLSEALHLWERGELAAAPFCPILDAPRSGERRRNEEMARTIEVFTAGCPLCQETLQHVREAVQTCGCNVIERQPDSPEAQQYDIKSVPIIVADGQVVFVGKPTREQAIALLRR